MKLDRREMNREMRADLDTLSRWARVFLDKWFGEAGKRHTKSIVVFSGDRFVITDIEVHNRKTGGRKK